MTGVSRSIAEHRLNIREGYSPVRQKKRGQAPERAKAIQAEVQKLIAAGIMREVYYHDWLSNPVMVKKHDGSWRMCVDFTDLNKACPQDVTPPKIDWNRVSLRLSTPMLSRRLQRIHQIQCPSQMKRKRFPHYQGVYCIHKDAFGLKNRSATYHRLVDKAFDSQVGRNMEVYVDDLVIKSHTEAEMLRDIDEMFRTLRKINMKLNPKKCTFGAVKGMFLGYTITPEGIKPFRLNKVVLQVSVPHDDPRVLAAIQNLEEVYQKSDSLDPRSGTSLQATKTAFVRATLVGSTQTKGGIDCIPVCFLRSNGSSAGLILTSPEGTEFTYTLRFQFTASNNEAEYEALIAGLRIAAQMGVQNVQVNVDSKLVANQVLGTYVAKEENMIKYLEKVKGLVSGFANFSISQVPRSKNKKADALSKIASTSFAHLSKQVLVEIL
ncbi:reverse transcriptase domain-containing protein [Tanacetum coccineum]